MRCHTMPSQYATGLHLGPDGLPAQAKALEDFGLFFES